MMISLLDIREALAALLKSAYPDWKVHFDNVERPHAPYFSARGALTMFFLSAA